MFHLQLSRASNRVHHQLEPAITSANNRLAVYTICLQVVNNSLSVLFHCRGQNSSLLHRSIPSDPCHPMDDRALGLLNPVEDDRTFATPYISQYLLWEQWCSVDQLGPYGSSQDETSTAAIVYTPTGPSPHDSFVHRSDISSTDLWSDNSPMTECTDPWGALIPITETSPSFLPSDPVTFEESPPFQDDDWHRPWIPTKQRRKRNRDTNSLPLRKSDRQSLSSDKDTTPLAKKKIQHTTIC